MRFGIYIVMKLNKIFSKEKIIYHDLITFRRYDNIKIQSGHYFFYKLLKINDLKKNPQALRELADSVFL